MAAGTPLDDGDRWLWLARVGGRTGHRRGCRPGPGTERPGPPRARPAGHSVDLRAAPFNLDDEAVDWVHGTITAMSLEDRPALHEPQQRLLPGVPGRGAAATCSCSSAIRTTPEAIRAAIEKIQGKSAFQGTFNENVFCDSFDTRL